MNRPNNRNVNRYDHEEIVFENYTDAYELPYHMQIQQQKVAKGKEPVKFRRTRQMIPNIHPVMNKPMKSHFMNEPSDGVTLDDEVDEEEDIYEEINEEEDAEYETGVIDHMPRVAYRPSDIVDKSSSRVPTARCISCSRCYTEKFRLFRWPRDEQVRRKWCDLLGIEFDKIHTSLDSAFLCAFHFSSTDFICSSDYTQIHWASQARPRPRPECQEPYQWEKLLPRIPISRSKHNYIVKFRASKYKVNTTKNTHPVAIVSSITRPNVQYEFSWNRTSPIDGTKFYSCLHCRKANKDSGGKDNVRTIHLNGTKLLSGQDPLSGHHHACTPITINARMDEEGMEERYDREADIEIYKKHNGHLSGEIDEREKNGVNTGERIVYVDNSHAFSSGAVVEVEASEGLWTTAEDDGSTVAMHPADGNHSNMDDLLLEGPSNSDGWIDYSKIDGLRVWKEEEGERRDTSGIRNRIIKKYRNRGRQMAVPSLSCPICSRRLPSTTRLIQHLEEHERNGGECAVCRGRIDPALSPSIRRSGICAMCKYQSQ